MAKIFNLKNLIKEKFKFLIQILCFLTFFFSYTILANDSLDKARSLFIKGEYERAINEASILNTAEAKILQSRILSIYTHFYFKNKKAEVNFLESYKIAKSAIKIAPENDEAYVEAAHALGRYGQKIGIMSAITKGIADRVKKYLDKALYINSENILANLSKGIWHAEIINQAGKTMAKAIYGAKVNEAIKHFELVKSHRNSDEIGVMYELAYGYYLLGEEANIFQAKKLLESSMNIIPSSEMDKLYLIKASKLLKILL